MKQVPFQQRCCIHLWKLGQNLQYRGCLNMIDNRVLLRRLKTFPPFLWHTTGGSFAFFGPSETRAKSFLLACRKLEDDGGENRSGGKNALQAVWLWVSSPPFWFQNTWCLNFATVSHLWGVPEWLLPARTEVSLSGNRFPVLPLVSGSH